MLLVHIIILIIASYVLIKSADLFVDGSSKIAKLLGVSDLVIGLTLVAIGTSLPEFASSLIASIQGQAGMAVGNVLGSNIANILLILGVSALFANLKTTREMLDRDGMIMIFSSILFYWLLVSARFDFVIAHPVIIRIIGFIMILMFFAYLIYVSQSRLGKSTQQNFEKFLVYFLNVKFVKDLYIIISKKDPEKIHDKENKERQINLKKSDFWHEFLIILGSCVGIILGANFFIREATWFAEFFGVTGGVVGLTLVALGTSLPELSVCVVAAKKGLGDMVVGNILGSNIANILFVGGSAMAISPAILPQATLTYTFSFVIATALLLLLFIRSGWQIKRFEGGLFLLGYVGFLALIYFGIIV
ncbi:calcium/sodium antiporter [Candidatus Woesearchaeota archaeon]|jgi:cation:H+ antiporter|nr:calcium/sodium antiporter [Candidatus Woesearchaeota archaeon]